MTPSVMIGFVVAIAGMLVLVGLTMIPQESFADSGCIRCHTPSSPVVPSNPTVPSILVSPPESNSTWNIFFCFGCNQLNTGNGDITGGDKTGGDKTGDNSGDKTGGDKTGGDKTGGDKTGGDKTGGDKTGDNSGDKSGDNRDNETGDNSGDKSGDKTGNKNGNKNGKNNGDKGGIKNNTGNDRGESNKGPGRNQTPSPLAFVLDPYDKIEHTTVWPDQCKLWNTENSPNKDKLWIFNPYHYEDVCMNVKITGGYVLFIDFNDNNVIDGCVELLCNFYKGDLQLTTYQILDNELTNANDDEWFSTVDPLFSKAKAWRPSENTTHTMDELNIMGFHIRDYWVVQDDYKLIGQYADCAYVQDNAYWEAIESGWECTQLAMHHMRIVAFDGYGVALHDGSFVPSYDFVFGYWEPKQITNTKIVDSTTE